MSITIIGEDEETRTYQLSNNLGDNEIGIEIDATFAQINEAGISFLPVSSIKKQKRFWLSYEDMENAVEAWKHFTNELHAKQEAEEKKVEEEYQRGLELAKAHSIEVEEKTSSDGEACWKLTVTSSLHGNYNGCYRMAWAKKDVKPLIEYLIRQWT